MKETQSVLQDDTLAMCLAVAQKINQPLCPWITTTDGARGQTYSCHLLNCNDFNHAIRYRHKWLESHPTVTNFVSQASRTTSGPLANQSKQNIGKREMLSEQIVKAMKHTFSQDVSDQFIKDSLDILTKLKEIETRQLRIALLAKPGCGKSFIFNYLIAEEESVTIDSHNLPTSRGPSPSAKQGSGLTGIPIWAQYGETPKLTLVQGDQKKEIYPPSSGSNLDLDSALALEHMRKQISQWDADARVDNLQCYVVVEWPSKWLQSSNATIIDV